MAMRGKGDRRGRFGTQTSRRIGLLLVGLGFCVTIAALYALYKDLYSAEEYYELCQGRYSLQSAVPECRLPAMWDSIASVAIAAGFTDMLAGAVLAIVTRRYRSRPKC